MEASQSQSCWDSPDWYDSNGDGCDWYYEENNCEYFGSQFASSIDELTANEAVSETQFYAVFSSIAK